VRGKKRQIITEEKNEKVGKETERLF